MNALEIAKKHNEEDCFTPNAKYCILAQAVIDMDAALTLHRENYLKVASIMEKQSEALKEAEELIACKLVSFHLDVCNQTRSSCLCKNTADSKWLEKYGEKK